MKKTVAFDKDCYNCEYCRRLRYLKGEWHCRIYKPDEVPNPCTCFVHRGEWPNCLDCQNWHPDDPRCMHPRSQWAGLITSPDNYCRFFERRPHEWCRCHNCTDCIVEWLQQPAEVE